MKNKFLLLVIFILSNSAVFAQVRSENMKGIDEEESLTSERMKPKFSIGVGVGFANIYGDFANSIPSPAGRIGVGCKLAQYFMVGIEAYGGQMASKEPVSKWSTTGFSENNNFEAVDFNAKVPLMVFIHNPKSTFLKFLSNVFIGTGYGFVNSSISKFTGKYSTKYPELNTELNKGTYTKKSAFAAYLPVNVGFRIPLKNFLGSNSTQFMLNYQMNYTFSDYIDGYSFTSSNAKNKFNDCYTVITVGFSFAINKNKEK